MSELFFCIYFGLIWFAINRFEIFKLRGNCEVANIAWGISIIGAVFTYVLYNNIYTIDISKADTFKFFEDAKSILAYWDQYPDQILKLFFGIYTLDEETEFILNNTQYWFRPYHYGDFNDNQIIIRLNMLLFPFSFGNYFTHLLFFSFMGFLGLWLPIKLFFEKGYINISQYFALLFFIIPNVFVWKSGVLKEPILLFGLGLLIYQLLTPTKKVVNAILILISVLLLIQVKAYVFAALLPVLIISVLNPKHQIALKTIMVYLGGTLLIYLLAIFEIYNIPQAIYQKQHDFYNIIELSKANSGFETFRLQPNMVSVLLNAPMAIINGFFRPFPWNCNTPLMWIAAFENLTTFIFLVYSFFKARSNANQVLTYLLLLFIVNLLIIVGLTTTVSGALVRYKMPATIAIWLLILYNFSNSKNEKASYALPFFWS